MMMFSVVIGIVGIVFLIMFTDPGEKNPKFAIFFTLISIALMIASIGIGALST